jgi:hypothetical protein
VSLLILINNIKGLRACSSENKKYIFIFILEYFLDFIRGFTLWGRGGCVPSFFFPYVKSTGEFCVNLNYLIKYASRVYNTHKKLLQ